MTIPVERTWAVLNTRKWLVELAQKKGPIRKTEIRQSVRWLLKHYPTKYDMRDPKKAFEPYKE